MSYRKIVKEPPKPVRQYHPAAAVKSMGDDWAYAMAIELGTSEMRIAIKDTPHDRQDAAIMRLCEKGWIDRIEP